MILVNLINNDVFVLAALADACSMVHLVLFVKPHLALLQTVLTWFAMLSCASCLLVGGT